MGETLTAATSGIADQDRLTGVTFNYQWVRMEEGSDDTGISEATGSVYTLVSAD